MNTASLVLLADHDEPLREDTANHLRAYGYRVIEVEDGMELEDYWDAMEHGDLDIPDVVISAISMPGHSGLEVLEKLRHHPGQSTPFIFLSEHGDWDALEAAEQLGAEFLFEKPYDADALRAAIVTVAA